MCFAAWNLGYSTLGCTLFRHLRYLVYHAGDVVYWNQLNGSLEAKLLGIAYREKQPSMTNMQVLAILRMLQRGGLSLGVIVDRKMMTKSGRALQILRRSVYHTSSPFASVSGLVVNSTIWNFLVTYVTYECGWRLAAQTAVIGPTDTWNYTIVCYIHCRILAIIVRIVTRPS